MTIKVAVWGTGNVGRPAIRAVCGHAGLKLAAVVVSNPEKVGRDAGALAGIADTGVKATDDAAAVLAAGIDTVVYTASADTRPEEAMADLVACLESGANVVSTSFYAFLLASMTPPDQLAMINAACEKGESSLFISGIDPGWAMDILPVFLSGAGANIREIRSREIFNYALYDAPEVVRFACGFGGSMDELPIMLHDEVMKMIWGPMVTLVAEGLGVTPDSLQTTVVRRALENTVEVPGMGVFEAGTQGAFRFEVQGICAGKPVFVLEHITRIDQGCAPDWPYPPEGEGCHQVIIGGDPDIHVTIHANDHYDPSVAAGGNATAANRIVNAIPAVRAAKAGLVSPLDLPAITGAQQLKRG